MKDLGLALESKVESVVEQWIRAVNRDSDIESARQLAYQAVRNSLPEVLKELAALLSSYQLGSSENLEEKSLYHGFVRAQQGYDTAEIVREYRILRQVVLKALEPELAEGQPLEIISSVRIIDDVLDQVVTASLESYIEARLTELKQMQGQLILTNQELVRLMQTQKENLSFMAHELKTPLNSIIGHSSLLLQKQRQKLRSKDTGTNLDQLEKVLRNGRRLLQIINDTLEISRYDQGRIQLRYETIELRQLVLEVIEDGLEPLAEEKGLSLETDFSQAPETVISDGLRLQQIATNLISNAIRYTNSGGIQVSCRNLDDVSWCMAITDTGIGIPEEQLSNIFEPYAQVGPRTNHDDSTGLGLAIVKRIISLMAGTVKVESEMGKGTTFTVTLPLTYET